MHRIPHLVVTFVSTFYVSVAMAQDIIGEDIAQAVEHAAHHADHAEQGASGLPQLDPTYFASQLFWLAICGILLYSVLSRLALPRIAQLKEERDHFVQDHLKQATELRSKAETAKVNYELALREAENKAKAVIVQATEQIRQKHDDALNTAMENIHKDIQHAEARLQEQKQAIMQTIDQQAAELATEILQKTFHVTMERAA